MSDGAIDSVNKPNENILLQETNFEHLDSNSISEESEEIQDKSNYTITNQTMTNFDKNIQNKSFNMLTSKENRKNS